MLSQDRFFSVLKVKYLHYYDHKSFSQNKPWKASLPKESVLVDVSVFSNLVGSHVQQREKDGEKAQNYQCITITTPPVYQIHPDKCNIGVVHKILKG